MKKHGTSVAATSYESYRSHEAECLHYLTHLAWSFPSSFRFPGPATTVLDQCRLRAFRREPVCHTMLQLETTSGTFPLRGPALGNKLWFRYAARDFFAWALCGECPAALRVLFLCCCLFRIEGYK